MRCWRLLIALAGLLAAGVAAAGPYRAPKNGLGQPDLGGVWNSDYSLPLEATPGVPLVLTEAQAHDFAKKLAADVADYASLKIDGEVADLAVHNASTVAVVRGEPRSRQVVEPADGVIPMSPRARGLVRLVESKIRNDPEISLGADGPDLRIIPFVAQHGPARLTGLLGDSIARWEGDTLVIETVRLPARDMVRPVPTLLVPPSATVEERYTRVGPNELVYQYTVRDPAVYTGPWLAEYSLYRTDKPILEFACHEGNYSLPDILAGARAMEREAAQAKAAKAAAAAAATPPR